MYSTCASSLRDTFEIVHTYDIFMQGRAGHKKDSPLRNDMLTQTYQNSSKHIFAREQLFEKPQGASPRFEKQQTRNCSLKNNEKHGGASPRSCLNELVSSIQLVLSCFFINCNQIELNMY